ncbi:hypothetical protein LOTGIDRAFT_233779 [Lottia gigantea]|uniref:glutathione transferase n=1 Tax=Lottia gigantea TaxID=225164 RepID=V4A6A8_LOTGI|nr:hypothetical protein LOTGIDRAFT_233779 [Lottia gigantea]ESO90540.1 hypothetical protein LOTGIDRAFT_233779 [Lottia gigantea]
MPKLGYWKIRGLAQPIRFLLNYVGEEFEDVQYEQGEAPGYSVEEWTKVKYTLGLDFPNLPYYIDGNVSMTQSNTILRYIGGKHDLLGKTVKEKVACDMMTENAMDFRNGVVRLVYNPDYKKLVGDYFKNLPDTLTKFENYLGSKPWFAGDKITICDFPMYELLDQQRIMSPGCLDKFPKLCSFLNRFEAEPKNKAYMSGPNFIKRPINNKSAGFR